MSLPSASPAEPLALQPKESGFQSASVATIAAGHFVHDLFSAFLSPLLPQIIAKLSLSLTQAGSLSAVMQLPSLLNPFIGYLGDRANLRWLVILAPAITATTLSAIGLAPSYISLMILLLVAGLSVAIFHALSPGMLARVSGRSVGSGMSLFMAGGELGRTVGPLVAVWAAATWGLEGVVRLAALGWGFSLVLYLRFRQVHVQVVRSSGFRSVLAQAWRFFLLLALLSLARTFLTISLGIYMPTLLQGEGASSYAAGGALALYQAAGVAGALLGGTLSDRLGRKPTLLATLIIAPLLSMLFLRASGWTMVPVLIVLGLFTLSTQPIMLALVQDHFPNHRSAANGVYMAIAFIAQSITAVLIGVLGDALGLRQAFFWSAVLSLLAVPVALALPRHPAAIHEAGE